jgi:hypothetical protein
MKMPTEISGHLEGSLEFGLCAISFGKEFAFRRPCLANDKASTRFRSLTLCHPEALGGLMQKFG